MGDKYYLIRYYTEERMLDTVYGGYYTESKAHEETFYDEKNMKKRLKIINSIYDEVYLCEMYCKKLKIDDFIDK